MSIVLSLPRAASRMGIIFAAIAAASAARAGEIDIYEHYGSYMLDDPPPGVRPIILDVPEKFLYGRSKKAIVTWETNILTYYPSFTSPADPKNRNFGLACAGLCNGRILISVEIVTTAFVLAHQIWATLLRGLASSGPKLLLIRQTFTFVILTHMTGSALALSESARTVLGMRKAALHAFRG
jgi:hypothetical protein